MNIYSRMMVARGERGWAKWVEGIKRYKLPAVKQMSWEYNVQHVQQFALYIL